MTRTDHSMQIRGALSGDAGAISGLLGELGFLSSPEEIRERLEVMHDVTFVAVVQDEVVGLITTSVMSVLQRPKPVGRISLLVVSRNQRGTGIGKALVAAAEQWLEQKGCGLVEVTSNFRLQQAHSFYKHIGYEPTSFRFKKDVEGIQPPPAANG